MRGGGVRGGGTRRGGTRGGGTRGGGVRRGGARGGVRGEGVRGGDSRGRGVRRGGMKGSVRGGMGFRNRSGVGWSMVGQRFHLGVCGGDKFMRNSYNFHTLLIQKVRDCFFHQWWRLPHLWFLFQQLRWRLNLWPLFQSWFPDEAVRNGHHLIIPSRRLCWC